MVGPSRVELEKKFFWIWFIYTLDGYVLGCTYLFFKVYFLNTLVNILTNINVHVFVFQQTCLQMPGKIEVNQKFK